jgi:hypothetical protein
VYQINILEGLIVSAKDFNALMLSHQTSCNEEQQESLNKLFINIGEPTDAMVNLINYDWKLFLSLPMIYDDRGVKIYMVNSLDSLTLLYLADIYQDLISGVECFVVYGGGTIIGDIVELNKKLTASGVHVVQSYKIINMIIQLCGDRVTSDYEKLRSQNPR